MLNQSPHIIVHPDDQPAFDQMESELRNELSPHGALEHHAFLCLITAAWQLQQCRKRETSLALLEPAEQNEANLEKTHRSYRRWEGSYHSAFRQIRLLQTDRAVRCVLNGLKPELYPPLADHSKIQQFARRNAKTFTLDDHVRQELNTQLAIIKMEKQILAQGFVPISGPLYAQAGRSPNKSTLCETKSAPHSQVGRNSPCPCGSGKKYKRCCGTDAPPIINNAA